jgi:rod shape-determining protein MreC
VAVTRRTSRSRFTLVLLVLTSITLLTLDVRGFGPLDSARNGALAVFGPVGDFASNVFRPIGNAWSGAFDGADLKARNDDLERQVAQLQGEMTQGQAAQSELQKLQAQENLPFIGTDKRVLARVSSPSLSNFDATIEIDKGSSSGLAKDQAVVSDSGLVGKVLRVSDSRAIVDLISDRSFKVGVDVAGAPGKGIVSGIGDPTKAAASQFDVGTNLQDGQILVTTEKSLFPPGIPVGKVQNVATDDTTQQKTADVALGGNLGDLTYVTVLLAGGS